MARSFRLAGLLRLRQIQQDQAASDLAAARRRANESAARERRAQASLSGIATDVGDSTVLYAIAAARASSRSMLAELQEIERADREKADDANAAFTNARARSVGLEKLERRHIEGVDTADLRAEQAVLDEIATRSWKPAEGLAL
jgi:flagellar FliJ protein